MKESSRLYDRVEKIIEMHKFGYAIDTDESFLLVELLDDCRGLGSQLEEKQKLLDEAIGVINLMRVNMKYIEPEYDELDIKVTAFLKKGGGINEL